MLLVGLTASNVRITLRAVLDFVEALLLAVEALQLDHVERVHEQRRLDCVVQGAVRAETWTEVNLDEPGFQIRVKKNIETKYLKAISSMHLILFLGLNDVVFTASHCLDDNVENPGPKQRHVDTDGLQMLAEGGETPFEAKVIVLRRFILDKVLVLLVHGVICQMHVLIVLVELGRVRLGSKACQALLIEIKS